MPGSMIPNIQSHLHLSIPSRAYWGARNSLVSVALVLSSQPS